MFFYAKKVKKKILDLLSILLLGMYRRVILVIRMIGLEPAGFWAIIKMRKRQTGQTEKWVKIYSPHNP